MKLLRHKGAAGHVLNVWSYDAVRRVVRVKLSYGAAFPLDVEFLVCTHDAPVLGAFCISRKTDAWQVAPAVYSTHGAFRAASIHPHLPPDFLYLTGAPVAVDEALACL